MNKKLIIQILAVELVRSLFIAVMILGVALVSNGNKPNPMVMNPQILSKMRPASQTEQRPPSVSGRKAEHLYHTFIIQTASHHQIDPALIKAIIMAESGYNTKAVSKKGAKGLMQLMPGTAQSLGVEDIFNPHQNITGGVQYFKQMVNRFNGDVKLALAAYNAGSRNVRNYNGVPPFKATHSYIKKVFKYLSNIQRPNGNGNRQGLTCQEFEKKHYP
ncbi:MAG: lytic transglycosylase domain-containing protein [Desulfobacterales bacterium]